jgi:small subunit ribosomal protein S2
MEAAGDFEGMPKREALSHTRELEKLSRNLSGIANLERLPNAVFVIDTKKEHIAVTEARKLGLPVVAVVDTNCDPDVIDYVIPGNDDAIRSGSLMCRVLADAVVEGRFIAEHRRKNAPPVTEEVNTGPSPRARRVPPPPAAPAEAAAPAASAAPTETAASAETVPADAPAAATPEAALAEVATGAGAEA